MISKKGGCTVPIFIDSKGDAFSTCWRRTKIAGIMAEAAKRRINKVFEVNALDTICTIRWRMSFPT